MSKIARYGIPAIFALTGYNIFESIFSHRRNMRYKNCLIVSDFEMMFDEIILKPLGYISFTVGGFFLGRYFNNRLINTIE